MKYNPCKRITFVIVFIKIGKISQKTRKLIIIKVYIHILFSTDVCKVSIGVESSSQFPAAEVSSKCDGITVMC